MPTFTKKQKPTQRPPSTNAKTHGPTFSTQNQSVASVLRLQDTIGNQAVQRLLQAKADGLMGVVVTAAPAGMVARAGEEGDITKAVKVTVKLPPPADYETEVSIKTIRDLVDAYSELSTAMFFDDEELMPDEELNSYWKSWEEVEEEVDHYGRTYAAFADQSEVVTHEEVKDFLELMKKAGRYGRLGHDSFVRKNNQMKLQLSLQQAKVAEAEKLAKKALRMQFLGGEGGGIESAFLWSMADHLGTLGGTLAEAADLPYPLLFSKILPGAISVANVVANWSSSNPAVYGTSMEGLAALNNVVSLGGLANSVFVNPGYIVTAYIGPMLTTITKMLGKLQMQLVSLNDEAAEILGNPLYIGSEPGGQKLWNYMVAAMHASSKAEIARPSGDVYDYFDKFSDRFDEFNQAKYKAALKSYKLGEREHKPYEPDEMPTESSYLVFSQLDAGEFPEWLYHNRSLVWTLLYGSRDPKTAKPIK